MKKQNKKPEVKTFNFEDHEIRAVMIDDEAWFIGKDVTQALGYKDAFNALKKHVDDEDKRIFQNWQIASFEIPNRGLTFINELGAYSLLFNSKLPTAKEFKRFVLKTIQSLREASGLSDFESFRMTDKKIQRDITDKLYRFNQPEDRREVIKANSITNKAIALMYDLPKTIGKDQMNQEMLQDRQGIYDDTVNLMIAQKAFNLDISISKMVYAKYANKKERE